MHGKHPVLRRAMRAIIRRYMCVCLLFLVVNEVEQSAVCRTQHLHAKVGKGVAVAVFCDERDQHLSWVKPKFGPIVLRKDNAPAHEARVVRYCRGERMRGVAHSRSKLLTSGSGKVQSPSSINSPSPTVSSHSAQAHPFRGWSAE